MKRGAPMRRTKGLKPGKPLSPISADRLKKFGFTPRSTLDKPGVARSARKPKRYADTDPDKATVDAVLKRAEGKCESCGDELYGRRGIEYSVHHRKRRSQGGDNRLSNLVALCGHGTSGCHGAAHSEVAQAQLFGFLVLSSDNPEDVPVDLARHGRSLLANDGGWTAAPEQEACARIEEADRAGSVELPGGCFWRLTDAGRAALGWS